MKYRNSLLSGAFCTGLLVLSACGAPQQIAYFQDFNQNQSEKCGDHRQTNR